MNIRILPACSLVAALAASALTSFGAPLQTATPVYKVAPVYSRELRADEAEGQVVVGFTITAAGTVENAKVIRSDDHELDRATLAAIAQWKFAPAMKNGVAVSVQAVQPVAFVLSYAAADAPRMVTSKSAPAQYSTSF